MNSNSMKTVLVAILVVVMLMITILQEVRVRRFKAEAEELRARIAQSAARTDQASALSTMEGEAIASLRASNEVLQKEVARLQGQINAASFKRPSPVPTAAGGVGQEATAAAPEETNAPMQGFSGLMKGAMEQQIMGQLDRMKAKLKLTPDQETAIRNILQKQVEIQGGSVQKMFSGKMTQEEMMSLQKGAGNPEEQIKALLDPDQLSSYQEMKKEESVSNARLMANSEVLQMQNALGLSQEQQDQVYEALYQQTMDAISGNFAKNLPKGADASAILQIQLDQKTKALEGVLTPEQLQKYRQMQEKQMEMIRQMMPKKSTPATPAPAN